MDPALASMTQKKKNNWHLLGGLFSTAHKQTYFCQSIECTRGFTSETSVKQTCVHVSGPDKHLPILFFRGCNSPNR